MQQAFTARAISLDEEELGSFLDPVEHASFCKLSIGSFSLQFVMAGRRPRDIGTKDRPSDGEHIHILMSTPVRCRNAVVIYEPATDTRR